MKKIIIFFFLIVLNSCGYNSIYNIDKSKVSIVDVSYEGDEFINIEYFIIVVNESESFK